MTERWSEFRTKKYRFLGYSQDRIDEMMRHPTTVSWKRPRPKPVEDCGYIPKPDREARP